MRAALGLWCARCCGRGRRFYKALTAEDEEQEVVEGELVEVVVVVGEEVLVVAAPAAPTPPPHTAPNYQGQLQAVPATLSLGLRNEWGFGNAARPTPKRTRCFGLAHAMLRTSAHDASD